jgi:hypothetical protein
MVYNLCPEVMERMGTKKTPAKESAKEGARLIQHRYLYRHCSH